MTPELTDRLLRLVATKGECEDLFWRIDGDTLRFYVNCSDVFAWACADAEPVETVEDVDALERAFDDEAEAVGRNVFGAWLYAARRRRMRPQGAAYPKDPALWPLYDACGPERETGLGNPRPHPATT